MKYLIVGFGNIGHKRQKVLGKKCTATLDPNKNVSPTYTKLEDIPASIYDYAVLTVPQQAKFQLAEHFLNLGKHVLIEKPFIITKGQGKLLSSLAKKNNCIWYTSYNHRFEPNIQKIKRLLEKGVLGDLYHGHFVYSFGNIRERVGTWRETEYGVLEEIAPHVIDFAHLFFNYLGKDLKLQIARKVESKIFDQWIFTTTDNKLTFQTDALTWKNIFSIDLYGKMGSIHLNGLRKWGGGELSVRTRVFPSGVPLEKITSDQGPDITWKKDFREFERRIKQNQTSLQDDLSMSFALATLSLAAKPTTKNSQQLIYQHIINGD